MPRPASATSTRPPDARLAARRFNFLTGEGGFGQVFAYGLTGLRWREDRVHLASGSVTVDLGRRMQVADIVTLWTDATPASYRILVSCNGSDCSKVALNADGTLQHPVEARYVRVELTQAASGELTGIRELQVISG